MLKDKEKQLAYIKEYNARPEVKARRKAYNKEHLKEYIARPEVKAKKKEYDKKRLATPEVKARRKAYGKEYHDRLEVKARKKERLAWYVELKASLSCCVCGESRIPCLDFHHRDPSTKLFGISGAVNGGRKKYTQEMILEEISKCDVYCKNCHAALHYYPDE